MPVISLVSDERSFFDYTTGIYTAGRAYDRYKADNSLTNGNCGYTNYTMDGVTGNGVAISNFLKWQYRIQSGKYWHPGARFLQPDITAKDLAHLQRHLF